MMCSECKIRPIHLSHSMCDICLTFADESYDLERSERQALETDTLIIETEFNYRKAAEESRRRIMEKFMGKKEGLKS